MGKSRKTSKRSIMKSLKKTASRTLPVVNKGLKTVGTVAKSSIPVIEKGVSAVYNTMATGLDVGVKGVKGVKGMTHFRTRSRSRSLAGGRRSRRHRRH